MPDILLKELRDESSTIKLNLQLAVEENQQLRAEIERLKAELAEAKSLSVTNVLIDIVPGDDGTGEEVYAKTVEDVEKLIGKLGEKAEDFDLETIPLRNKVAELHQQLAEAKKDAELWREREAKIKSLKERGLLKSPLRDGPYRVAMKGK